MQATRYALVRIGCALAMLGVGACPRTAEQLPTGGTAAAAGAGGTAAAAGAGASDAGHANAAGASPVLGGNCGSPAPGGSGAAGGGGAASSDGGVTNAADGGIRSEEDGGTVPDDCAGVIVEDVSGCLQDDAFCTRLNDGRYCTGSATPHCPPKYTPIAKSDPCPARTYCFDSESLRCSIRLYTPEECAAAGGVGLGDPGDGSLECPGDAKALGALDANLIEGGLCCPAVAKRCGARAGDTCQADEFCDYQVGQLCGAADAEATCKQRSSVCTSDVAPVCGCDGTTYANACAANAAGSGINTLGACK